MGENFLDNFFASCVALLALFALIAVVMVIYNYLRMRKQKNYYEDVHKELSCGQRVMFSDGLYGKVVRVGKETCDVEVKSGTIIEVSRYAIQEILDGGKKSADKQNKGVRKK